MRSFVALAALLTLAACDDMSHQAKKNSYADRSVAPGPVPQDVVAYQDAPVAPLPVTEALLERGQQRYRIDCVPCHGETGAGNGMIVQRGFPAPASFHTAEQRGLSSQHVYDVITNGKGIMYGFAARVAPADRWAIVAYIRALQLSRRAVVADLGPGETLP